MNDVFLMVDDFNSKFSQGDWIEFEDYQGRKNIGKVSAQAEVIDGNPIVALDDIGIIDISEYGIKAQVGASIGRPDDFDSNVIMFPDSGDEYIPLENDSDEETPPYKFGEGDFGGGGSSDSFETPEDGQQDDQDEDWEGDESEGEVDDSDDNDDE